MKIPSINILKRFIVLQDKIQILVYVHIKKNMSKILNMTNIIYRQSF